MNVQDPSQAPEPHQPRPDAASTGDVSKRALLIGIRTYPNIPPNHGQPLAGCHHDVEAMRHGLLARGFADSELHILVDVLDAGCACIFCAGERAVAGVPTQQGIRHGVDTLVRATEPGDVVAIYFSGHGSEFTGRRLVAGRRFQTLVPHDSGRGEAENRDILDREIEGWIRRLNAKTPHVTLIFDCCHSGGLSHTRGTDQGDAQGGRRVAEDARDDQLPDAAEAAREPVAESRGPSGWLRGPDRSAVVLSGSAAKELSVETTNEEGRKQGLFTHHLSRALRRRPEATSWLDLFPEVAESVTAENLAQHPRREGAGPIFEVGDVDPHDTFPPDVIELEKLAVVIGLDYREAQGAARGGRAFPPLRTPRQDALEVARVLRDVQGYEIVGLGKKSPGPLLNEKATRRRIHRLIDRLIQVKARTSRETAVVIYFAGHGVVRTEEDGSSTGYLVPWDADAEDPSTWLPMKDLRDQLVDGIRDPERLERLGQRKPLARLTSRHLLLVLDCCFGGALSYDFFRGDGGSDRPIYYSEYKRFVEGSAWQLMSSASASQQALDRDPRDPDDPHSPFARAWLEALTTDRADTRHGGRSDHLITAGELHQFIDARLRGMGVDVQSPGLTPLRPIEGQFIFHVPGFKPSPLADPPMDPASNPWRGDVAYDQVCGHFYGRELATLELLDRFLAPRRAGDAEPPARRPLAVLGAAGTGKTSLLFAGLLPLLADPAGERRRYRSVLSRWGHRHLLLSAEDLASLRAWAAELGLGALLGTPSSTGDAASAVAEKVRTWAVGQGWIAVNGAAGLTSRLQLESLGMPSFSGPEAESDRGWISRVGLLDLLDSPTLLTQRLRLWLDEGGLADFMTAPPRGLRRLVGRWRIVFEAADVTPPDGEDPKNVLWVIDAVDDRLADVAQMDWTSLEADGRVQAVATVSAAALAQVPELAAALEGRGHGSPAWDLFTPPKPTRAELREVIEGPAADRVLVFRPQDLPDRLVEETYRMPAPLPQLSAALAGLYETAWHRRRDADRELLESDLPEGGLAGMLAQRAEGVLEQLGEKVPDPDAWARLIFLRAVSFDGDTARPRRIAWEELDFSEPDERKTFHGDVLPALLRARLLVADRTHLELAGEALLTAWPKLRGWIEEERRKTAGVQTVWHRALEWRQAGYSREKLWTGDPVVGDLWDGPRLNELERCFLMASELLRRTMAATMVVTRSIPALEREWSLAATLIGRAALLARSSELQLGDALARYPAREDREPASPPWSPTRQLLREAGGQIGRLLEHALHHALASTPLSIPLPVTLRGENEPTGSLRALGFHGEHLLADLSGELVAWNLEDFERLATPPPNARLKDSAGRVPASRQPVPDGPRMGPKAQAGHDETIRFFASGYLDIPDQLFHLVKPPMPLLGHRAPPEFLVFSESQDWLASGGPSPEGQVEIRLWPLAAPWGLPREPRSVRDVEPGDLLVEGELAAPSITRRPQLPPPPPKPAWPPWPPPQPPKPRKPPELPESASGPLHKLLGRTGDPDEDSGSGEIDGEPYPLTATSVDGRFMAAITNEGGGRLWAKPAHRLLWSHGAEGDPQALAAVAINPAYSAHPGDGEMGDGLGSSGQGEDSTAHGRVLAAFLTAGGQPWFVDPDRPAPPPAMGPGGRPGQLAFSPDGRRLAVGDADGSVRLWEVRPQTASREDAEPLLLPGERHQGLTVTRLVFDAAGEHLLVARQAVYKPYRRTVQIYRLDIETLIRLTLGHAARGLTREDLPPELPPDLAAALLEEPENAFMSAQHERELYLQTLLEGSERSIGAGRRHPHPEEKKE